MTRSLHFIPLLIALTMTLIAASIVAPKLTPYTPLACYNVTIMSSGEVRVSSYFCQRDGRPDFARSVIRICPQHALFWPEKPGVTFNVVDSYCEITRVGY